MPQLEKKLSDLTAKSAKTKKRLLREEVTEEDIAKVVSSWTGIPVSRLQEGEREKLVKLEAHLHQRVVGQDEAIKAVSNAVRRTRRFARSKSSDRFFHFSRADRRRQNRTFTYARGIWIQRLDSD